MKSKTQIIPLNNAKNREMKENILLTKLVL